MADLRNLPVTRDKLGQVFGSHQMVKWAEDLQKGVKDELPALIEAARLVGEIAEQSAASAHAAANRAEAHAEQVEALLMLTRSQAAAIEQLRRELDELRALTLGA